MMITLISMICDLYLDITEMASSNETCSVVLPTHACWLVVLRIGDIKIKTNTTLAIMI